MTGSRDWDKDLAKIDRQIGSMSDADLLAATQANRLAQKDTAALGGGASSPVLPGKVAKPVGKWGVYFRAGLSLTLAIGLLFWPYDAHCGPGLFGYLLAAGMVCVTSVWSGIFSWKVRMPAVHILSLLLFGWGIVMGGAEVLPRVGYAIANEAHPATWLCR